MPQFSVSHHPSWNGQLSCKFERYQSIAAKLPRLLVVQCLRTPKTRFLNIFGVKRILLHYKFAFFNVSARCASNGVVIIWVGLSDTVKLRIVLVRTWKPQSTTFSRFWAQNPILTAQSCLFRFWYTLYSSKEGSYRDIFSLVTAIQKNCKALSWSFPENPEKHLFPHFFGPEGNFLQLNLKFLLFAHQSVLVQTLKRQENSLPLPFFSPNCNFFLNKVASFLFQNLVHPIGWLPFDFERPWSNRVKFRIVLVRTWKPQNTTFSHFLAQNPILAAQSCLFRFWYTLYAKVGSYPVNLSLTGAIHWNCEMFSRSFPEKTRKPVFYTFFRSRG